MSGKNRDLTGEKFERLTVIERIANQKGRKAYKCLCSCGNYSEVLAQSLLSGATRSCGCLYKELNFKNLAGKQFGKWNILSKTDKRSAKGYIYWSCECECGLVKNVDAETLISGTSQGCSKCAGLARKRQFCINNHDTHVWGRTTSQACRACIRDKHLRTHYGISLEEYIALYHLQDGKCAICGKELGSYLPLEPGFQKGCRVEVDHDHKLGKRVSVRGLLCGGKWAGCNRRLGRIDNVEWLKSVVNYLENPPAVKYLNSTQEKSGQ